MTSRKAMWAGMDRLEGKKEGSSYKHLEKEQKRQGYKSKALEGAKLKTVRKSLISKKGQRIEEEKHEAWDKHGEYKD